METDREYEAAEMASLDAMLADDGEGTFTDEDMYRSISPEQFAYIVANWSGSPGDLATFKRDWLATD